MRLIQITVLCTALALPGVADAQSEKIQGSQLLGLCAAALEFVAGVRSSAGVAQPLELQTMQRTRDLFLGSPGFPAGEVEAYANAWSQRMSENFTSASGQAQKGAVATDIGTIAQDCQQRMFAKYRAAQQRGEIPLTQPAQPQPVQPLTVVPQ